MNDNTIELAIGVAWLLNFVVAAGLTWELGKTAARFHPDNRWPLPGRWLIVFYFASLATVFLDIVRLRLEWRWLNEHWADDPVTWLVFALRVPPLVIGFWMLVRLRRTGRLLTAGEGD